MGIAAVIAGSKSFAAIGQWAGDAGPGVLAALGAERGPAEEFTYRRAFALVSADVLDRVLGAWLHTRAVRAGGRVVIAIDGTTVRGAKSKGGKARHLVAVGVPHARPDAAGLPADAAYFVFDEQARLADPIVKDALGYHRRDWQWSDNNAAEVEKGWITRADDPAGLARQLGLPADALTATIERYNAAARSGLDADFGRAEEKMSVLKSPFYGIPLWPCLLNTQGGPRHGTRGEVIGLEGIAIPGLFAAGELGSIWTDLYPGGGNLIEAIVSGRIAGAAAAAG